LTKKTKIRIDFIFSFSNYEKEALKRVKKIKVDDVKVNYASIEDLVIHKIIAGRERELEDVKSIFLKNKKINENYILKWLSEFESVLQENLIERFKKVKKEVKL